MHKAFHLLALALLGTSGTAIAGTAPLDTGYDHGAGTTGAPYSSSDPVDNYWIKIASYEPPNGSVPVASAYIYHIAPSPLGGNSKVLGPRPSSASSPGTDISNKAYAIYRKCFCLLSTQNASLSFRVVADDGMLVWLNTIMNPLVGPLAWPTASSPQLSRPTNIGMFQEGRNCLYVLVEDYWSGTSFALRGQVSAPGLMPMMAKGNNASFEPCPCPGPRQGSAAQQQETALIDSMFRTAQARDSGAAAPVAEGSGEGQALPAPDGATEPGPN